MVASAGEQMIYYLRDYGGMRKAYTRKERMLARYLLAKRAIQLRMERCYYGIRTPFYALLFSVLIWITVVCGIIAIFK